MITVRYLIKLCRKEKTIKEENLAAYLMITSMFFKHPGFHEEKECRIVISGNINQEINFRADKINKIIIGPGSEEEIDFKEKYINDLLRSEKLNNIKIVKSGIPYIAKKNVYTCNKCQIEDDIHV